MKIKPIIVTIFWLQVLSGCSVHNALNLPHKRDLSVFKVGTPRSSVIGELGKPILSETVNGKRIDTYSFTQGFSPQTKAARAAGHGLMNLATIGLWEVAASPVEAIANGNKIIARAEYDHRGILEKVTAIKGWIATD